MLEDIWTQAIVPALVTISTVAIAAMTTVATAAIRRWAEKQKAQWVSEVMTQVADAVDRAVAAVNQTFVDEVKAATADGKLTRDDAAAAAARALNVAKEQLGADLLAALVRIAGSNEAAEMMLGQMIEASVKAAKGTGN